MTAGPIEDAFHDRAAEHDPVAEHDRALERVRRTIERLAPGWGLPSGAARATLISVSENATFRLDDGERPALAVRHYRPGYHSEEEMRSELAWVSALARGGVVRTPPPVAHNGDPLVSHAHPPDRPPAHLAAFGFVPGAEPEPDVATFKEIGALTARLHRHARRWQRPTDFVRKSWTFETTLGERPHWGRWQDAAFEEAERSVVAQTVERLRERLRRYGSGADRFGLIHADLRAANLVRGSEGALHLIDFDDCGFGWFAYDFAASVSFVETNPALALWRNSWLEGYRTIRRFGGEHETMLADMVMLRRILLTAWLASRPEADPAAAFGNRFPTGTAELAEHYLRTGTVF